MAGGVDMAEVDLVLSPLHLEDKAPNLERTVQKVALVVPLQVVVGVQEEVPDVLGAARVELQHMAPEVLEIALVVPVHVVLPSPRTPRREGLVPRSSG